METQMTTTDSVATVHFTAVERRALQNLRTRYDKNADFFSHRELAHLSFLRWLVQTGRLTA
jgi:hypothetical protein